MPIRLLLLLALFQPFAALATPTTAELTELFMPAQLSNPKLSPNGDCLAFMARRGDILAIGVYDFATRKMEFKGGSKEIVPTNFWWKTPTRLLVQTTSDKRDALGYTAFDADGKNVQDVWRIGGKYGVLYDALPADPHNVLMLRNWDIVKVNIDTDEETTIVQQLNHVNAWMVDERGQPRAALQTDFHHGEIDVWWNKSAGGPWQFRTFTSKGKRFYPQAVAFDPRYLLGWEFSPDEDVTISRMDTTTGQVEVVHRITGLDPTAMLLLGLSHKPIAIAYEQGATMKLVPLAESDGPRIESLEKQFSGYITRIVDTLPDGKNWLVWVGNSRLPGAYVLFNHQTSEANVLAFSHDGALKEDRFAFGEYFNFQQRGGARLSARLWRPRNNPQPPLIVICPGELPAQIAEDVYQPEVQAFVLQGFAVLQVNPRNSWGFGKAGRQIPREQWISTLQEDLDDAVQSLVAQQLVDPAHVNLYGRDFGGVLALQVAARSKLFTAIATINIPREVHRDDLFKLTSEPGTNPLVAKFGGWAESEKFAKELSPIRLVSSLPVRALYLHNEEGSVKGRLTDDGRGIRDAAKNARLPAQSGAAYTWSLYPKLPSVLARENAAISAKVADFFHQTGPAAAK